MIAHPMKQQLKEMDLKITNVMLLCIQVFKTNFIPHRGKQSYYKNMVWRITRRETHYKVVFVLQGMFSFKGKEFDKNY